MLGILAGKRLRLWRRVAGRLEPWHEVHGDPPKLARAVRRAQELDELAAGLGGWSEVFRLGFDPVKPRHLRKISPRVESEDDLNGGLG
jgi:hypothetical protein